MYVFRKHYLYRIVIWWNLSNTHSPNILFSSIISHIKTLVILENGAFKDGDSRISRRTEVLYNSERKEHKIFINALLVRLRL